MLMVILQINYNISCSSDTHELTVTVFLVGSVAAIIVAVTAKLVGNTLTAGAFEVVDGAAHD